MTVRRLPRLLAALPLATAALLGVAALTNERVGAPTDFATSPLAATAPPPLAEPIQLRVITYNIADGYLFTSNRRARMRAIAQVLRDHDPDLVGLQEAFIASDRDLLWRELAGSRLRHQVRFPGAAVGNGLWILSAHPIEEAWFHRFEAAGRWYRFWEGDFWAGKGVGLARVRLPGGALLDFFDTHAQAGRGNPENEAVRYDQMGELARFVRRARLPSAPALVVGDFNTRPGAPDYRRAAEDAPLERAMLTESEIDHVFAVSDAGYRFEVLDTVEIAGTTLGSEPELFLARPPSFGELRRVWFGAAEETRLSDHPGYRVTVRITPTR